MKVDPFLPIKLKCPKLFEVDDKENHVLKLYDEGAESRRNNFGWPSRWAVLKKVLSFRALMIVSSFFFRF